MLWILTGTDRVSLSISVFEQINRNTARGFEGQVLIVPEQFSHETERNLCQNCGDTISRYAEVLSFSRLSDRVAAYYGGIAQDYLDKGGQLLTMAYAAEQVSSRIKLYASVLRKPEYLCDLLRMIEEFRSYCLEPSDLFRASKKMEGRFSQKLEELALLYEAYLAACMNGKADPSDRLIRLRNTLAESDWAAGRIVYLDGFSDFTGAELDVLERLICQAKDVYVTVAVSGALSDISESSNHTVRELQRIAERFQVEIKWICNSGSMERDPAVQRVLTSLFQHTSVSAEQSDSIQLRSFRSIDQECRLVVQTIKSLLQQGERCRDISIACTDPASYLLPLRSAMGAAKLPVYFSGENDLIDSPVIHAVTAAVDAACGSMDYDDFTVYLKSWLPELDPDTCDRLDNYAFQWSISGKQWEAEWTLHPRGFGELWNETDWEDLRQLNLAKEQAFGNLFVLRRAIFRAKTVEEMVFALYEYFEAVRLRGRLEEQTNRLLAQGQMQKAQEISQIYEVLCQSLEQLWLISGQSVKTPEDFSNLYRLLLTQYKIGTIPAGLDQIHVSDLPDLRHRVTKHLFVLGCSDGLLPAYRTSEGILTDLERLKLLQNGITIAPSRADQMDLELERISAALYSAQKSLWLSYVGDQPAWLFRRACAMYPDSFRFCSEDVFLDVPSLAAWRIRNRDTRVLDIPDLGTIEENLRSLRAYSFSRLAPDTVRGLYGKDIYLSASRIDKYASCRFAFFLAYGMKAKPRKRAQMDPSIFGTFVHAVLENVVQRVMDAEGFRQIPQEKLLQIAMEEINDYVELHFPEQAERSAYLFGRSKTEILDIVMDLGEELRNSLFQPVCCELEFSSEGLLPSVEIQGEQASCRISGFVDRVDLYEDESKTYVRVVDYKTGKKDFDYTDILNGVGLQMLIYLFALRQYGGALFRKSSLEPAGVLYVPARKEYTLTMPFPDDLTVAHEHQEERRRKGLIRSDPQILAAMEANPETPVYMPYEMGRNGLKGNLADHRQMILLERHVLRTLANMADQIAGGDVTPNPMIRGQYGSCRYCDYVAVCHKDFAEHQERTLAATSAEKFWDKLEQEEAKHG